MANDTDDCTEIAVAIDEMMRDVRDAGVTKRAPPECGKRSSGTRAGGHAVDPLDRADPIRSRIRRV